MALWLMADAEAYVDAGSTLATNGQTVRQWEDQSGNNNHATNATSGERPQFVTGVLNGLPAIRFINGKGFHLAANVGSGDATIFLVGQYQNQSSFDNGNWVTSTASAPRPLFLRWPQDHFGDKVHLSGVDSTGTVAENTFFQLNGKVITATNAVAIRISQAAAGSGTGGGNDGGMDQIAISGSNLKLRGDICELLVYNSALNSTDIGLVETYLNGKWGV